MSWVFRALGALEVTGPGGTPTLASARERTILAVLLLEANRPVSVERLVDAVWDESPPATARGQIQICVSRLRRALSDVGLPQRISTRPPGYLLKVEDGELDLHAFEQFVTAGLQAAKERRPAESAEALHAAIGLFAGEPLSDVDSSIVRSVVRRLLERKMVATEECIEAELTMGAHHEVIGALTELVSENPLRERLRALQMAALHRAGRSAEALAAYQEARRGLIDELGVEPGAVLRALHMEILTGESDPKPEIVFELSEGPPAESVVLVPRLLPLDIADFAGRGDLVERLEETLRACADQGVKVVAISGKGGVGKTTLALRVAHRIAHAFPDGQLYAELRGADMRPTSPERILVRFLRALGVSGGAIPAGLDECAELYRNQLAGRHVLVVLDAAIDEEQVMPLLPGSETCAVLVTSRGRLGALPGAEHVHIDMLELDQAVTMLERMIGRDRVVAELTYALTLAEQCCGLPLALRVAAARLKARPHWTISQLTDRLSDERRRLDELVYAGRDIRASIAVSYNELTDIGKKLFCRLSLCEIASFPEWIAAPLLDCDPDTGAEVLEVLVDAQLVDVSRMPGGTRYRLHDLIRIFAQERLAFEDPPAEQMAAVRRVMATWLFLTDEAHLRIYGGDFTRFHGTAQRRVLSGARVDRIMPRPLEWLDTERSELLVTISQAAGIGADEVCWELAIGMITLFEARIYFDDWRDTIEIALPVTLRAGNRRGEAAVLYSAGTLNLFRNRLDEAAARLRAAWRIFDELGEAHGAALALRNLASINRTKDRPDSAEAEYMQAIAVLGRVGDLAGEAHIHYNLGQLHLEQGRLEEARRHCRVGLDIADTIDNERITAQALSLMAQIHTEGGDLGEADRILARVLEIVRLSGDRVGEAYALYEIGAVRTRQGRHEAAELALNQARTLAQLAGEQLLAGKLLQAMGELNYARGDWELAAANTSQALNLFDKLGAVRWQKSALAQLERISAR